MGVTAWGSAFRCSSPSICISAPDACEAAKFDSIYPSLPIRRNTKSPERKKSGTPADRGLPSDTGPVCCDKPCLKRWCRPQNWMGVPVRPRPLDRASLLCRLGAASLPACVLRYKASRPQGWAVGPMRRSSGNLWTRSCWHRFLRTAVLAAKARIQGNAPSIRLSLCRPLKSTLLKAACGVGLFAVLGTFYGRRAFSESVCRGSLGVTLQARLLWRHCVRV